MNNNDKMYCKQFQYIKIQNSIVVKNDMLRHCNHFNNYLLITTFTKYELSIYSP